MKPEEIIIAITFEDGYVAILRIFTKYLTSKGIVVKKGTKEEIEEQIHKCQRLPEGLENPEMAYPWNIPIQSWVKIKESDIPVDIPTGVESKWGENRTRYEESL
jgi:hypothetical protein